MFCQPFLKRFIRLIFLGLLVLVVLFASPKFTLAFNPFNTLGNFSTSLFNVFNDYILTPIGEGIYNLFSFSDDDVTITIKPPAPVAPKIPPPIPTPSSIPPSNSPITYITNNIGPRGPQGPNGERGLQGLQGSIGPIGPRGPAGSSVMTGGGNNLDSSSFVSRTFFDKQVNAILNSIDNSSEGISESLADRVTTVSLAVSGGASVGGNLTVTGNINGATLPTSGTLYGTATDSITSLQLLTSVTNETGTGALVFATSPTFATNITTPLIVGGTSTTSDLSLQTTSGVGETGADMHFLVGNNGATEAMTILNSGYVGIGMTAPLKKLDITGGTRITGTASSTLTGTADPTASTTLSSGAGTLFTTELVIGDRITINGETRTVTAIASDTSLTVDTAFTDTAPASITKLPSIFTARLSSNAFGVVVNDLGNVGIGTAVPVSNLTVNGYQTLSFTPNNPGLTTGNIHLSAGGSTSGDSASITFGTSNTTSGAKAGIYSQWANEYGTKLHFRTTSNFGVGAMFGMTIDDDGALGIGTTDPEYALEIKNTNINQAPEFGISDSGVIHGLTTLATTNTFLHMGYLSSSAGGTQLTSISDTNAQALSIRGIIGSTNPTDTFPAIKIIGAKSNGTTGIADLGALETVFQIANNDDASALTILGNGNLKLAGTAVRATTEGTNHIDIFDGTAPIGTLANGISLYSTTGELRVMDSAGNATLLSPHENTNNYWIFDSTNSDTGKSLVVDMELMMKRLNETFGWDYVHETIDGVAIAPSSKIISLDLKLEGLEKRIATLEANGSSSLSTGGGGISALGQYASDFFNGVVSKVENGVAYMKGIVVETLKIGSPTKRVGITLYDEITGEPYCLSVANGVQKTSPGECVIVEAPISSSSVPTLLDESTSLLDEVEDESTLSSNEEIEGVESSTGEKLIVEEPELEPTLPLEESVEEQVEQSVPVE